MGKRLEDPDGLSCEQSTPNSDRAAEWVKSTRRFGAKLAQHMYTTGCTLQSVTKQEIVRTRYFLRTFCRASNSNR